MAKPSLIDVLVEDQRHQQFVLRWLKKLGYLTHHIHLADLPSGRGCGEQWVREHYAKLVRAYRSRSTHAETALVVAIDADRGDLDRRVQQLRDALIQDDLPPREANERIAHFIPRRNIETWILCLNGDNVDEETDYSKRQLDAPQVTRAALTFYEWTRPNATPPRHCVPSLRPAIDDSPRIHPLR